MSYAEKPEDISREEWMEKLNNVHIQRADMNRLIMNYLVTGTVDSCITYFPNIDLKVLSRSLLRRCLCQVAAVIVHTVVSIRQRASRRRLKSFAWSPESNPAWTLTL